jgi:hypothetical protein
MDNAHSRTSHTFRECAGRLTPDLAYRTRTTTYPFSSFCLSFLPERMTNNMRISKGLRECFAL